MDEKEIPSVAEIHIASSHLRAIDLPITPILTNISLNKLTGRNLYLKCENFQRTGSFKSRGALNFILNIMKIDPNVKGFVTYSAGNHGVAVSYAASLVQRPCIIVISDDTPKCLIQTMEYYGSEIISCRSMSLDYAEICLKLSEERDFCLIPISDHPDLIAGYGTIAVELLEQLPDLDAILVPVDDGGLISGIALYAKRINPNIRIYACVSEGRMLEECLTKGKCLWSESSHCLKTKCQACRPESGRMRMCSLIEKQVFTVSDKMMIDATRFAFEHLKLVIELASGLSLGAALSQYHLLDSSVRNLAVIFTGGNIDLSEALPWQQEK